jgi:hypothetical protein
MFKCLCCDQIVTRRGQEMTPKRAHVAWRVLEAMGYTRERLLTEHCDNLDFTAPGFTAWLKARPAEVP